jgi:hypothetical protein
MLAELLNSRMQVPLAVSSAPEDDLNEMLFNASVLEESGALEEAENKLLHALDFARSAFGDQSTSAGNVLLRIGSFYSRREKYWSARKYMDELLNLFGSNL